MSLEENQERMVTQKSKFGKAFIRRIKCSGESYTQENHNRFAEGNALK